MGLRRGGVSSVPFRFANRYAWQHVHQSSRYPLIVYQQRAEYLLWLKGFWEPVPSRCQLPIPHAGG
jgi:hypothetical protein